MPIVKRLRKQRREWSAGQRAQLEDGWDYFGDSWGSIEELPPASRQEWPTPEALEEMRDAWEELRDELLANSKSVRPLFAEMVFERGMAPRDAMNVVVNRKSK